MSGKIEIVRNIAVGLVVSIVMLNLGAAMGILSGRGVFAGILSAGIIAIITSAFGGTRIQGSGTTAPMSTVTAVIVAYAMEQMPDNVAGISPAHFVNITIVMSAAFLILFSVLKLGRLISYVPNLVVSGFMCGIAIIIWMLQIETVFGLNNKSLEGPLIINLLIVVLTIALSFMVPWLLKKRWPRVASFVPGTLVALVTVSVLANVLNLPIAYLQIQNSVGSFSEFKGYLASQVPTSINADVLIMAAPFASQLALLCYIDTLLTSLVVDKLRNTKTKRNKELLAQGFSTALAGLVGGVPGAQSTVPSVLTIKEGATMRVAGVSAGIFVLLGMVVFAPVMGYIPQAVFAGILMKVGYDVFDFKPLFGYFRTLRRQLKHLPTRIYGHKEIGFFSGTAFITAFVDLITAVSVFTIIYHALNFILPQRQAIVDRVS